MSRLLPLAFVLTLPASLLAAGGYAHAAEGPPARPISVRPDTKMRHPGVERLFRRFILQAGSQERNGRLLASRDQNQKLR